ncbi:hypothetical protein EDD85DRAFT_939481 [Armillaria nabsnona]|nr:hypothetical protein EDD85DRAFT_939481 [Armillaria nabsnona]
MTSEGFVFHRHVASTNDPLSSSPEEDLAGASSTLSEFPIIWNTNVISSGYGLVMSPGTCPPPSICQLDLFDQATTGSFPICYGDNGEIMPDQRSAFQNSYVAAQRVRSYPPPSPSLYPSNDATSSDLQDWFASIDGGSDDTWFSSFLLGDLDDLIDAEKPSVPGNCPMEVTNCEQNGFCSLIDFLTFAPSTSSVLEFEKSNAFHAVPGSVLEMEHTDVVASGIQTPRTPSVSTPVTDAMDATDGLIKPWQVSLRVSIELLKGIGSFRPLLCNPGQASVLIYASISYAIQKEIGNHLRAKHYGIEAYDDVTCKECGRTVHAKSYQDHFLQLHSERSIHCAYCNSRQVRVQNLPRHFNVCPGLDKYWRARKGAWVLTLLTPRTGHRMPAGEPCSGDSIPNSSPYIGDSDAPSQSGHENRPCEIPLKCISSLTETGKVESSIQVPWERAYRGRKPVIPLSLADIPCIDLGVDRLLSKFNITLGTSYTRNTSSLSFLLDGCITKDYDFGTAYGRLRPFWYKLTAIEDNLCIDEKKDQDMRQKAIVCNRIVSTKIRPRRVWDLYSNRVMPCCAMKDRQWPKPISHAWVDERDRIDVWTPINGSKWPVPIPNDTELDLIRIEMLNLGAEYTWPDVLCLRQKGEPREDQRSVPVQTGMDTAGSCEDRIIAGDTEDGPLHAEPIDEEGNYADETLTRFHQHLRALDNVSPDSYEIFGVLAEMRRRMSAKPVDKVAGLAFRLESTTIPAYSEDQSLEGAWTALVDTIVPWLRGDLFFGYPEQGKECKKWRPSWGQVLMEPLPEEGECGAWVGRDDETGEDCCEGYSIENGYVRGLAVGHADGVD